MPSNGELNAEQIESAFDEWVELNAEIKRTEARLWELKDQERVMRGRIVTCMSTELAGFSVREKQVMTILRQGKTNKEIGQALNLAERTVKFHVSNILRKAGKSNRYAL